MFAISFSSSSTRACQAVAFEPDVLVAADDVVEQGVDILALVGALLLTELLLLDLGRREEHAPSSVGGLGLGAIVARLLVRG